MNERSLRRHIFQFSEEDYCASSISNFFQKNDYVLFIFMIYHTIFIIFLKLKIFKTNNFNIL